MELYVKVTGAGGITIPAAVRRKFSIEKGDAFRLQAGGKGIVLTRSDSICHFCNGKFYHDELADFLGKPVCAGCMKKIRKAVKENGGE